MKRFSNALALPRAGNHSTVYTVKKHTSEPYTKNKCDVIPVRDVIITEQTNVYTRNEVRYACKLLPSDSIEPIFIVHTT